VPDWGMWDMTFLPYSTDVEEWKGVLYKRCCGYKGHWECADDYPDRMVPVSEFSSSPSRGDGYQPRCNRCNRYVQNQQPVHPDTGQAKRTWKEQRAVKLGGDRKNRKTYEWKSYLNKAGTQWDKEFLNPGEDVIAYMEPTKSEFSKYKPMTKRIITEVEGEEVPEGPVYIVQNPDLPEILKIGKTFPDGMAAIMSSARRFQRAVCLHTEWFEEAYQSEQAVHKILEPYNLRKLIGLNPETGKHDCGKELFRCSLEKAMSAIEEVKKGDNTKKQALG